MPSFTSFLLTTASLASLALAKTDLEGCTSSTVIKYGGASLLYYVPGTGEICDFLDCGGGRAPPKTTVPGCAAYSGTATYSPSYLPGYGGMADSTPASTASASASSSASSEGSVVSIEGPRITSGSYLSLTPTYDIITTLIPSTSSQASSASDLAPYSYSSSSSSSPAAMGTGSSATASSNSNSNGTVSTGTSPSVAVSTGGADKLWVGSAGLLALGGLIAAL